MLASVLDPPKCKKLFIKQVVNESLRFSNKKYRGGAKDGLHRCRSGNLLAVLRNLLRVSIRKQPKAKDGTIQFYSRRRPHKHVNRSKSGPRHGVKSQVLTINIDTTN